jgi:protein TonB
MFSGVLGSRRMGRRSAVQLAVLALHGLVLAALLRFGGGGLVESGHAIAVHIVAPAPFAGPLAMPRLRPAPRPAASAPAARRPEPLVAPTALPELLPEPGPKEEPLEDGPDPGPVEPVVGVGGRDGGVVGGAPDGEGASSPLLPARPADLAAVRAGIGRTAVYPALARARHWQGRPVLSFTLLADGSIDHLLVRQGSGYPCLDEAALEAVRRAAPFPAPGVAVQIILPVDFSFRR